MLYLLDTNIIIFALKFPNKPLAARLTALPQSEAAICSIVEAELYHGALKYTVPGNRIAALDGFLSPFDSLPFESNCARQYAELRHRLERQGQIIGGNDMMIASIALANDLTLITHNVGEFSRVSGLRVEDWS